MTIFDKLKKFAKSAINGHIGIDENNPAWKQADNQVANTSPQPSSPASISSISVVSSTPTIWWYEPAMDIGEIAYQSEPQTEVVQLKGGETLFRGVVRGISVGIAAGGSLNGLRIPEDYAPGMPGWAPLTPAAS